MITLPLTKKVLLAPLVVAIETVILGYGNGDDIGVRQWDLFWLFIGLNIKFLIVLFLAWAGCLLIRKNLIFVIFLKAYLFGLIIELLSLFLFLYESTNDYATGYERGIMIYSVPLAAVATIIATMIKTKKA